ncbi:MAG: X-Pro dipeptidyl-peptidase domain protein [Solirubrobacterales bacterium]|nr:X-Pro dipeptidyl-peptidase domain protein [Solirubrobacterales bacterium]
MRPRSLLPAALALAALAAPAPASAAPPAPFGHDCAPKDGVLFCPTTDDAARVPAFDGVPLDVDVTMPATGDGPFPTIAMIHGFGGSKSDFENATSDPTYNAAYYARAGYAVVTATARGFGRSCGVADSRTAGCERGWIHLDDQRYEIRDVQDLLGRLVDEGIAQPNALGVTGISYGGGASLMLATLRDRIRNPDGSYSPWRSPAGQPLSITAAWPRWPWSDLADALAPNGRILDPTAGATGYRSPIGVGIENWLQTLYAAALSAGFVAPKGADPGSDLMTWQELVLRGEPYGKDVAAIMDELHAHHSSQGLTSAHPSPLLIQAGWTDDLFPVGQTLRAYNRVRAADRNAPISLQIGDFGHQRGANHPADRTAFDSGGLAFFDSWLKRGGAGAPKPGAVTAYTSICPKTAPSGGGPYAAASFSGLARGSVTIRHAAPQRVTSSGGDASLSTRLAPLRIDQCAPVAAHVARSTAIVTTRSPGFTLLGMPRVVARVAVTGHSAQLVARLWDVDPTRGSQRLIDRGVTRVPASGTLRFTLNGNGWRFPKGHLVKVELLGRDGPTYRPSSTAFSVTVRDLRVTLPTRERRG